MTGELFTGDDHWRISCATSTRRWYQVLWYCSKFKLLYTAHMKTRCTNISTTIKVKLKIIRKPIKIEMKRITKTNSLLMVLLMVLCMLSSANARLGGTRNLGSMPRPSTTAPKSSTANVGLANLVERNDFQGINDVELNSAAHINSINAPEQAEEIQEVVATPIGGSYTAPEKSLSISGSAFGDPDYIRDFPEVTEAGSITLSFQSKISIDFFRGTGREPDEAEITTFLRKTQDFFESLFEDESSFQSFVISEVQQSYDATNDPDHWQVEFVFTVEFDNIEPSDQRRTLAHIAGVINTADYKRFIRDYIWMSPPLQKNEFYQTHHVDFSCYPIS